MHVFQRDVMTWRVMKAAPLAGTIVMNGCTAAGYIDVAQVSYICRCDLWLGSSSSSGGGGGAAAAKRAAKPVRRLKRYNAIA